ncbi:Electron transport complex subunit RsxB [Candidatus Izimaplasma bacterium HR1]|jgi:Fe-S-cluster-containing hydrogenase component 2|uniref:4Fe-4S binding protein n=1 Tax=Candidatus Izimoplasma sp. HR1 TaxID=1541959 RepID=UPI0004F7B9A5|nr:Electron transport complex subunit RsxB [Candidatus Izimaplasma bacterium HR1]
MLSKQGTPTIEQVKSRFPNREVLIKPKAITECYESIPCNPCSTSCPFDAIHIGEDINTPPTVDFDKCSGCSVCVYNCPGLAIFTVQEKEDHMQFKIPYEFVPYPENNEEVYAINRNGDIIGDAVIKRTQISDKQDKTALLTVKVSKELLYEFITIRRKI